MPGERPGADTGVTGSWLDWIYRMDRLLCCWQEWGGRGPSASHDELWDLDDGRTFSVTHVGACWIPWEHFVVLSVQGPIEALASHQRSVPTVDAQNERMCIVSSLSFGYNYEGEKPFCCLA